MMNTNRIITLTALSAILLCSAPLSHAVNNTTSRFVYPEFSQKISMDFKNAQLNDVLKILSQQSGRNFIASEDIADKLITLYLDQVPVDEALDRILRANKLTYEIEGPSNIFVVREIQEPEVKMITRVYYLKHASVISGDLENTIDITVGEEGSSSNSSSSTSEEDEGGIREAIENILTDEGRITEDPRTNSLVITDMPSQFAIIEQTIARLDVPLPQILIEVEMLDISKSVADDIGVQYSDDLFVFTGASRNLLYPFDQNKVLRDGASLGTPYTPGSLSAAGMQATVDFLRTHTDTKNLARPKILTLNNKKAEIRISTNEAIGLNTTSSGEGGGAQSTTEAERVETGVFLTVTPQANMETGEITLAVAPRVVQARTGGSFNGITFRDPEERGAQAVLRITDGQTIMIGGLIRENTSDTEVKLPILGDIPFFGGVFRHRNRDVEERELVIFLTPHIVNDDFLMKKTASANRIEIHREQDAPTGRSLEIDKALSVHEKKKL